MGDTGTAMPRGRPVLVGEDNPYRNPPMYDLYPDPPTSAGGRLCFKVLGLTEEAYFEKYERVNLCRGKWNMAEARATAAWLVRESKGPLVLLGAKVCKAFNVPFRPFVMWTSWPNPRAVLVILGHPSGRCRLWNEPGAFERARAVLRKAGAL